MVFSNKIVDLFGKIVDLLFERGVLPHLENPPGYGPVLLQSDTSESLCKSFEEGPSYGNY